MSVELDQGNATDSFEQFIRLLQKGEMRLMMIVTKTSGESRLIGYLRDKPYGQLYYADAP